MLISCCLSNYWHNKGFIQHFVLCTTLRLILLANATFICICMTRESVLNEMSHRVVIRGHWWELNVRIVLTGMRNTPNTKTCFEEN